MLCYEYAELGITLPQRLAERMEIPPLGHRRQDADVFGHGRAAEFIRAMDSRAWSMASVPSRGSGGRPFP